MLKHKSIPMLLTLFAMLISACNIPGGENVINNSPSDELSNPVQATDADSVAENTQDSSGSSDPAIDANAPTGVQSACYHPYFPISDGAAWTYQEANGEEYTLSVGQTADDTFTLTQNFTDSELLLEMDWYCGEDGLLNGTFAQIDLLNQTSGTDNPEIQFESLKWEGMTLPPVELLTLGYRWITSYEMSSVMSIEGLTSTTEVHVKLNNTLGSIEEVSGPAGTFPEAYRVDSVGEIEMIYFMGEIATTLPGFQFTYSTWYVEGVGMVKSSNDFSGIQSDIELIDSTFIN